jgi:hypothetical protein
MPKKETFDLHTFVASDALEGEKPFPLSCNCGGVVTIMPPFQDEYVVCPRCESRIRMLLLTAILGTSSVETAKGIQC